MADAFGVAEIDCFADVEAEAVGGTRPGASSPAWRLMWTCGIDAVEIVEHEHLPVVLGHGHVGVFGLDEVDADDAGILRGDLEGEKGLGEDLLRRKCAKDLVEEADLYGAGGPGAGLAAVFNFVAGVEGVVEFLAIDGDFVAEAGGEESVAEMAEVCAGGSGGVAGAIERGRQAWSGQSMRGADLGNVGEDGRLHDFEVLLVLGGGAGRDFVEPFAGVGLVDAAEAAEGGEELVVAADAGAGDEAAHGEGVDEGVVELLILEGALGADVAFATDGLRRNAPGGGGGFEEAHGLGIDAEEIGGGVLDEGFGVDGAGEMHVEVGALGHAGRGRRRVREGFASRC